jgi:2-oxoglutarate ferredoxin oxidoreductase subunit beta
LKNSDTRDDVTIRLEHGQKLIFGANQDRCVVQGANGSLQVAMVADVKDEDIVVHDAHNADPSYAFALTRLSHPESVQDTPIGVFRDVERPTYESGFYEQLKKAEEKPGDLAALLAGKDTWEVR